MITENAFPLKVDGAQEFQLKSEFEQLNSNAVAEFAFSFGKARNRKLRPLETRDIELSVKGGGKTASRSIPDQTKCSERHCRQKIGGTINTGSSCIFLGGEAPTGDIPPGDTQQGVGSQINGGFEICRSLTANPFGSPVTEALLSPHCHQYEQLGAGTHRSSDSESHHVRLHSVHGTHS